MNWKVRAVHVNHCLRGEESLRDEGAARAFCCENKIPLTVKKVNIRRLAAENHLSEEECGREIRYRAFAEEADICEKAGEEAVIVTAHTLSDDLETTLFHLVRGCTLDGLCGIPQSRMLGEIPLYRPMLKISRKEVEAYCEENGLSFVTDSTNLSDQYSRNFLRLEVIPLLKRLNPSLEEGYVRMREHLEKDRNFLNAERDLLLRESEASPGNWRVSSLLAAPPALRGRACAAILRDAGCEVSAQAVEALEQVVLGKTRGFTAGEKKFSLRGGNLVIESALRILSQNALLPKDFPKKVSIPFSEVNCAGETVKHFEKILYLYLVPGKDAESLLKIYKKLLYFSVDYDTIINNAVLRTRHSGDSIRLSGRNGSKPLKKLFQEARLSRSERETRLIFADSGGVIWVEGFGNDESRSTSGNRVLLAFREPILNCEKIPEIGKDDLFYGTENG